MSPERQRYRRNLLVEVIFQLQFPTILKIDAALPAQFQESIRDRFPYFTESLETSNNILVDSARQEVSVRKLGENKNYSFISADEKTRVNLTSAFIAVSTVDYHAWDEFKSIVDGVISDFQSEYKPSFYNRVGLRYINILTRTDLGFDKDEQWSKLIRPEVLGSLGSRDQAAVQTYSTTLEAATETDGVLSRSHVELVHVNNLPEVSLLMDFDYFALGITPDHQVQKVAGMLHDESDRFFLSSVTETLESALKGEVSL